MLPASNRTTPAKSTQSGVYAIWHRSRNRVYIGSAVDIKSRWRTHRWALSRGRHHSVLLQRAWDKYGPAAFDWEVVEVVPNPADLVAKEQEYLDSLRSFDPSRGFNVSPNASSCLGVRHSKETREKMSRAHKGQVVSEEQRRTLSERFKGQARSPECIAKMRTACAGRKPPRKAVERAIAANKGRKRTPEQLAKIRTSSHSPEVIAKRVAACTGKKRGPYSEEHKAKISAALKGKSRGPKSAEHRAKIAEAVKRTKADPAWKAKRSGGATQDRNSPHLRSNQSQAEAVQASVTVGVVPLGFRVALRPDGGPGGTAMVTLALAAVPALPAVS